MSKIKRVRHYISAHRGGIMKIIENPIVIGAIAGAVRNVVKGKQAVDVEKIKTQVTQPNLTNPLLFLGAGLLLRSKALQAIGAFLIVDPPEETAITVSDVKTSYKNIPPEPSVIIKTV